MLTIKTILSIISIVLIFISYSFYIKDILRGKSKPHVFTWGLWSLIVFILFLLQLSAGAKGGAYPTLFVSILCITVFVLSLIKEKDKNIKFIDIVFLIITLLTIPIWLLTKDSLLSTILLIIVYSFAGEGTIRKSWIDPYSETISLWAINAFRGLLSILALSKYNFITLAFPTVVFLAAFSLSFLLIFRRNILKLKKK